jgi:multiple antibiotic resistance protein
MSLLYIAFSLFLLMDSIGNIPLYLSFLKKVPHKRQKVIIIRELLIALGIILVFSFIGNEFMSFLKINEDTIQIAGGIILFILCLRMIFPQARGETEQPPHLDEPFIVPLAVPLVAGPAVLAAVMIYTRQENDPLIMIGAILLAWFATLVVLLLAPFLQKILGWRGITALERLMGLILILIAVQMFLSGLSCFTLRQVSLCTMP